MREFSGVEINHNIECYLRDRKPESRYTSFDYCYNYFQSFRENSCLPSLADDAHLQQSCLQIGFFLASWGMIKGKAFLLQKSAKFYERLIDLIAAATPELWEIDAGHYTDGNNMGHLLECYDNIAVALQKGMHATPTLVTKVMLGVFGSVPAFDTNFVKGLGIHWNGRALGRLDAFYKCHQQNIDKHHIRTFDFAGRRTDREYPRAKIIDMVGFIEGRKQLKH